MEKRDYTHVQILLPEIKAMLAEGNPGWKRQSTADSNSLKYTEAATTHLSIDWVNRRMTQPLPNALHSGGNAASSPMVTGGCGYG